MVCWKVCNTFRQKTKEEPILTNCTWQTDNWIHTLIHLCICLVGCLELILVCVCVVRAKKQKCFSNHSYFGSVQQILSSKLHWKINTCLSLFNNCKFATLFPICIWIYELFNILNECMFTFPSAVLERKLKENSASLTTGFEYSCLVKHKWSSFLISIWFTLIQK